MPEYPLRSILRRWAIDLEKFLDDLLNPRKTLVADVRLLGTPIEWSSFLKQGLGSTEAGRPTSDAYRRTLEQLWESESGLCLSRFYLAVEQWLHERTLATNNGFPKVTIRAAWMLVAVHNWLWWHRHRNGELRALAGNADEEYPPLKSEMELQVDPFLDRALPDRHSMETGNATLGDLIAFHLLAVHLGRLTAGSTMEDPDSDQKSRLHELVASNALTRLGALGPEGRYCPQSRFDHWCGIETLMADPAAVKVWLYLAGCIGQYAAAGGIQSKKALRVLNSLRPSGENSLVERAEPSFWHFVGQLLRGSLSAISMHSGQPAWNIWHAGFPEPSLAQWCGRLARWAESQASNQATRQVIDLWRDLAHATLPRWTTGEEDAIACWGLWLLGYLESEGDIPRISQARDECGHSLDELINHWMLVSYRLQQPSGNGGQTPSLTGHLGKIERSLKANAAFSERVSEPLPEKEPSDPRMEDLASRVAVFDMNLGEVKAYRYRRS